MLGKVAYWALLPYLSLQHSSHCNFGHRNIVGALVVPHGGAQSSAAQHRRPDRPMAVTAAYALATAPYPS